MPDDRQRNGLCEVRAIHPLRVSCGIDAVWAQAHHPGSSTSTTEPGGPAHPHLRQKLLDAADLRTVESVSTEGGTVQAKVAGYSRARPTGASPGRSRRPHRRQPGRPRTVTLHWTAGTFSYRTASLPASSPLSSTGQPRTGQPASPSPTRHHKKTEFLRVGSPFTPSMSPALPTLPTCLPIRCRAQTAKATTVRPRCISARAELPRASAIPALTLRAETSTTASSAMPPWTEAAVRPKPAPHTRATSILLHPPRMGATARPRARSPAGAPPSSPTPSGSSMRSAVRRPG